jgi:Bacteriophage head to tail connecting protein
VMAQAQKAIGLGSLERFSTFVTTMVAAFPNDPSVGDKPDVDQIFDEYAKASGLPPRVVRSDEQVAAMREERSLAAEMQREAELLSQAAPAVKDLASAPMGQDSALDALLGNAGLLTAGAV